MPRIVTGLLAALPVLLGAGCAPKPKPEAPAHSAFSNGCDFTRTFESVEARAGVKRMYFGIGGTRNAADGKSNCKGPARYYARPDQIDELMRLLHSEFTKQLRESGAEMRGDAPPPGPTPVREWLIAYSAGPQEGTIWAIRGDGAVAADGQPGQLEYKIEFLFDETPKSAP